MRSMSERGWRHADRISTLQPFLPSSLAECRLSHPHVLWESHKVKIFDDLWYRLIALHRLDSTEEDIFDYGLYLLQTILQHARSTAAVRSIGWKLPPSGAADI